MGCRISEEMFGENGDVAERRSDGVLVERGIAIHSGPFQPNPELRFLYVLDPDGLKVQFVEFSGRA